MLMELSEAPVWYWKEIVFYRWKCAIAKLAICFKWEKLHLPRSWRDERVKQGWFRELPPGDGQQVSLMLFDAIHPVAAVNWYQPHCINWLPAILQHCTCERLLSSIEHDAWCHILERIQALFISRHSRLLLGKQFSFLLNLWNHNASGTPFAWFLSIVRGCS